MPIPINRPITNIYIHSYLKIVWRTLVTFAHTLYIEIVWMNWSYISLFMTLYWYIIFHFSLQEPHRSWRNERFFGVPLCATDCESWFNDCRADYTCVDNWAMNFDWVAMDGSAGVRGEGTRCPNNASSCKVNVCPRGSSCTTFQQMYGDAKTFCERVWDGSWKVLDDSKPCMRLWFSGKSYNPNDKVAGYYAATARAGPSAAVSSFAIIGLTLGLLYRNI